MTIIIVYYYYFVTYNNFYQIGISVIKVSFVLRFAKILRQSKNHLIYKVPTRMNLVILYAIV